MRVHIHPCLRVHDLKTIAPVAVSKIRERTRARLAIHFTLPRDAMVRRLEERQNRHRRATPEEYLMYGKHAAVRRGRGADEPLRGPQNRLHPQTRAERVSNSLESLEVHVREKLVYFNSCRVPRLDRSRESALYWAFLLWRIWRRQFAADSETVRLVKEHRVGVLGAVISPKRSRNSHVGHKTLHQTEDGTCMLIPGPVRALEARSAVHEHDDISRASQ